MKLETRILIWSKPLPVKTIAGQNHSKLKTLLVINFAGQNINSPKASGDRHIMVTGYGDQHNRQPPKIKHEIRN